MLPTIVVEQINRHVWAVVWPAVWLACGVRAPGATHWAHIPRVGAPQLDVDISMSLVWPRDWSSSGFGPSASAADFRVRESGR